MNNPDSTGSIELKPGIYEHYKGNRYEVLRTAVHTETNEVLVIYKALYGAGEWWARPLAMFMEYVEIDGVSQPRFTYVFER